MPYKKQYKKFFRIHFTRGGKHFWIWVKCNNERTARDRVMKMKYPVIGEWKKLIDPKTSYELICREIFMDEDAFIFELRANPFLYGINIL